MKLPRVQRVTRNGKSYKYHRITGGRLPADVPEDDPAFISAWTAEEGRKRAPKTRHGTGTIGAACTAYLSSKKFMELSEGYRRPTRRHISTIVEEYGTAPIKDLRPYHIQSDLAKLPANPARARRKAWRLLCAFALASRFIAEDPSDATKAPKAPKTDGHEPWSVEEIAAFRDHWPIEDPRRLAFELTYWTGARISDACRLTLGMVGKGDGVLTFTQKKTKGKAHVPWTCAMQPFADLETHGYLMACIEAQRPGMALIVTIHGKPRSEKALGNWMAESARLAGVQKSAHGLRKSRLIQLAENGAPALAMMAWSGHKTLDEVQHYIIAAERKRAILGTEQDQNPVNKVGPTRKKS